MHQVIMNLCTNEAHAMWETGGVLEVELRRVDLDKTEAGRLPNLAPGSYVLLRVRDTGRGMAPEVLDRGKEPIAFWPDT